MHNQGNLNILGVSETHPVHPRLQKSQPRIGVDVVLELSISDQATALAGSRFLLYSVEEGEASESHDDVGGFGGSATGQTVFAAGIESTCRRRTSAFTFFDAEIVVHGVEDDFRGAEVIVE